MVQSKSVPLPKTGETSKYRESQISRAETAKGTSVLVEKPEL